MFSLCINIIIITIVITGFGRHTNTSTVDGGKRNFRLPKTIVPEHYKLEIQPYLIPGNFNFVGNVEISLYCVEKTSEVVLHVKELKLDEKLLTLSDADGKSIEISKVKYVSKLDFAVVALEQNLTKGEKYFLSVAFKGGMSYDDEDENGFYISTFTDEDDTPHYSAVTRFEPYYARKVFPCFDEPAMKATFDITILRWKNMSSLSNMPKKETKRNGEWEADVYQTSKSMSTCYVGFFIGKHVGKTKNKITIWTPPENSWAADFALEIASLALSYYESVLEVPYPLPKLDIIAIEENNAESFGMITTEELLLKHPLGEDDSHLKLETADSLTKQIAEQWFGNLVTPKWWNDDWLTIGLADFLARKAMYNISSHGYQEWELSEWFQFEEFADCSETQNFPTISTIVNDFEDLTFDDSSRYEIIRNKVGKVIEMLIYSLKEEFFWKGLKAYLKENLYGNADSDYLWFCLTEAQPFTPKVNLKEMMKPWIEQRGRPVVTVNRNYDQGTASLEQVSCRASFSEESKNDLWGIPIVITTQETSMDIYGWFSSRSTIIKNMPRRDEWILFNDKDIANHHVIYDRRNWQLLSKQLQNDHQIFDVEQRSKLLKDVYTATISNSIESDIILEFYIYLPHEENVPVVMSSGLKEVMESYSGLIQNHSSESTWKDYVTSLYIPLLRGFEKNVTKSSSHYLRYYMKRYLCRIGYPECVDDALKQFEVWKKSERKSNIESYEICTAIQYGGMENWEYVFENYGKDEIIYATLACSTSKEIIQRLLKNFPGGSLKKHPYIINELISNGQMWEEFFHYVDRNCDSIINEKNVILMEEIVFKHIRNPLQIKKVISLLEKHEKRAYLEAKEILRKKIGFYKEKLSNEEKNLKCIAGWLQKRLWEDRKQK